MKSEFLICIDERIFISCSDSTSSKFKFEPAYSGKQRQSIDSHSEDIPHTQNEHAEQTEQGEVGI